jgi:menaquinone-dependent protoporphyrinogen oxidase
MAGDVLIVYASKRGSTEQVARRIGEVLRAEGLSTTIESAEAVESLDGFRAVVLGGSLYMGRWHKQATRFLHRHRKALATLPVAVFALGPGKDTPEDFAQSRQQLDRALEKEPGVQPRAVAVFGGVVDPDRLRFPFNRMPKADLRDWSAIFGWAKSLLEALDLVAETGPKPELVSA